MRKLTGYIGALIIVFALMGSILAGYALNVNGSTAIINEYEKVTDVSGLYTHSQEPSYIDYNPASNYIGYSMNKTYDNTPNVVYNKYKDIKNGTITININTLIITVNGSAYYGVPQYYPNIMFICDKCYIEYYGVGNLGIGIFDSASGPITSNEITININNGTTTVNYNGISKSLSNIKHNLIPYNGDDWDYIGAGGTGVHNDPIYAYVSDNNQIVGLGYNGSSAYPSCGTTGYYPGGTTTTTLSFDISNGTHIIDDIYYSNVSVAYFGVYFPRNISYSDLGINYTESNRVNNYPMETDYNTSQSTTTASMDLMAVSTANEFKGSNLLIKAYNADSPEGNAIGNFYVNGVYSYKLSNLIPLMNIPANTTAIKLDCPTTSYETVKTYQIGGYNIPFFGYFLSNYAVITGPDSGIDRDPWQDYYSLNFETVANQYVIYYPDTQICELFNGSGVKIGTYDGPDKVFITFVTNSTNTYPFKVMYGGNSYNSVYDVPSRVKPFMNIIYSTTGTITNVHYSDITKGYEIKNDNVANVVWDNQYSNGNIQILFRAEDTNGVYHNDIIVGDNTISVDYTVGGYSITLNSGDPVNVGKWRNIVLDMDLRTGGLSAIPVRTFNSYTNVVMDTASIVIGDMVNPAPTNIIEWAPTVNSFVFNIYSTSVFMNTYGVVMINPQLDITQYFTDLNGFYRMRLYNFSMLGGSITVNGVTADVANNSITIDEQTVQVKDMAITYADGHAYISDSNVNIDLGETVNYSISMTGAWYFETELLKGFTSQKLVYEWDWGDFILNNTQFCIMYMGIALVALMIARHYCTLSITDYIVLIVSFAIALTVQVVA